MLSTLRSALRRWASLLCALALCSATLAAAAQPPKHNPSWAELNPQQQEILAPLAGEWDKLDADHKKQWLGVAKRYPKMTPTGKKRVQTRMRKWAELTPEQREEARRKYLEMQKTSRKKNKDLSKEWAEYEKSRGHRYTKEPAKSAAPPAAVQ